MKAELIDFMGTDLSVVDAARVSFAADGKGVFYTDEMARMSGERSDEALIRYLAKHNHWTPFAHTAITFRVSAPVPIRTQCFKHKVGFSENEESRRYISSTPEIYIPGGFRNKPAGNVKQGSDGLHRGSSAWVGVYREITAACVKVYEAMIGDGVCPEQARFVLPQGAIVNWYWTGNLAAYARFFNQRTDPNAQEEVRVLAGVIGHQIEPLFPVSWKALTQQ